MKLLDLAADRASLEFAPGDQEQVMGRLGAFGPVTVVRRLDHAVVTVAGQDFIHMSDWDEPCLIAGTSFGVNMLAKIAAESLASTPRALRG